MGRNTRPRTALTRFGFMSLGWKLCAAQKTIVQPQDIYTICLHYRLVLPTFSLNSHQIIAHLWPEKRQPKWSHSDWTAFLSEGSQSYQRTHTDRESSSKLYVICRMISRVHLLVYSPSLLGDMNWGGSFAPSHNPTAVYMTFFPNSMIQKFFPGFSNTLFTQYH